MQKETQRYTHRDPAKRGELSPTRLGAKLKQIRLDHQLTQGKMLIIVNPTEFTEGNRARISQYENGWRVPSPVEIYNYARFAGVSVEMLLDDNLDLPSTTRQSLDEQQMTEQQQQAEPKRQLSNAGKKEKENLAGDESERLAALPPPSNADEEKSSGEPKALHTADNTADESFEITPGNWSQTPDIQFQTKDDPTAADFSSAAAAATQSIYSIRLSEQIDCYCKQAYLKLLDELPFEKFGQIPPDKFLEQSIAAALDDYYARRLESALARRMRFLFGEEDE